MKLIFPFPSKCLNPVSTTTALTASCLLLSLQFGCKDSDSDDATVGPTPGAVFTQAADVKYDVILPDIADFGTIIGDRTKGAHGTFVKIKKGTGTPSHTHGAAYHAVILKGLVENPFAGNAATEVKMGVGSYYFVPAGSDHITRCASDSPTDCMTFFYQDSAFDFNPDVSNVSPTLGAGAKIVLDADVQYSEILPGIAQFGTVYGNRETGAHGTFVKITKGKGTPSHTHTGAYHAVILEGIVENPIPSNQSSPSQLGPGSHYYVPAGAEHITRCAATSPTDCRTYFYQDTAFDFVAK
jgi:quercetin dioxygenase-like cupin family protein